MGCSWRKTLSFFLVFVPIYLHGASSQEAAPVGPRKPFFERLRRLEEQFRRFQEVTWTHLQNIASNYNVSYNVDVRFRSLAEESQAVAQAVNRSQASVQGELAQLKAWVRKLQRRGRKVDTRLRALDLTLGERSQQRARERKAHKAQRDALQDSLARLEGLVHSQGARLAALEGRLPVAHPGTAALGPALVPTPTQPEELGPTSLKLQRDRQELRAASEHRGPPQDSSAPLQGRREPPASGSHRVLSGTAPKDPRQQAWSPQVPGEICGVGPTLVFPNASTRNVVFLSPGFVTALRALSFCSWVRTASGRLGTLLSYATEDNDNKLVLHGRDSLLPGSIHFVIGDPAFRELPLQLLLDGQWHHICVIWTSTQGRYWLHVDRRLVATGSRFREGYEIPPGGSLVLGQEQDSVGGGFDSSEAFVGSMSGLAIWDRALVPGEVANLAIGKEFPTGAILTLANAALAGGFVQGANCTCLERCP
ncbi:pentraxin 4 [Homo sapiens]|uniref:Pentraxin-4 n=1 Tax=Homo sapiens TaxID=9606 RepID=PTX4_HUMAN|nr:pentraxin-4 isoform 1 precursor [Homo sapiens]Q96A99.2 RecName: Full=Pentraxin-4; Flags: Precursor [Homo sapiens]KAI4052763.1 pentraxin 4 [Homo sapiens]|eukprot:NP_001315537.1 pentraxin-4 isoform 1 precursor [Homo sapiens]